MTMLAEKPVLVATGMDFEARLAEKHGGALAVYGQNRPKLLDGLHTHARAGVRGLLSFGTAGGLLPALKPGDIVVATAVLTVDGAFETDARWTQSLLNALPHAYAMPVYGSETPIISAFEKEALASNTGAAAVDMESQVAAAVAAHYALPFAVLRVVIDPADRAVPLSAIAGVREDGTTDAVAVLRSLLRHPRDIPGIIRLAGDSQKAKQALADCRKTLGPLFGLPEPVEVPLHTE
ncbi:hopanoid-associated phosphorylase [Rhodomicrobium vannielii ATCC 17100]|jgi:hopanoid-associated phosphorylase|uniref:Hopanoid-associated phosphorylase n=1 Tax=Rhodomicrobium vannielii (strain ATCC 17100 / DSM 162 / LMG 4299 / NCIMB 10020 / ATH 3.1.1) TaxID=648757 RepID=E3I0A2_RHOVT|nr:phosphorylase [Rhodomicrobium vannielii]ADP72220.1 hopanoid-associated phosphorylase [Rhodomicrobium vannielii ATCC 17100]